MYSAVMSSVDISSSTMVLRTTIDPVMSKIAMKAIMDVLQRKTRNLQKQFTQIFEENPPLHLYGMHLRYKPTVMDGINTLWRSMKQKIGPTCSCFSDQKTNELSPELSGM